MVSGRPRLTGRACWSASGSVGCPRVWALLPRPLVWWLGGQAERFLAPRFVGPPGPHTRACSLGQRKGRKGNRSRKREKGEREGQGRGSVVRPRDPRDVSSRLVPVWRHGHPGPRQARFSTRGAPGPFLGAEGARQNAGEGGGAALSRNFHLGLGGGVGRRRNREHGEANKRENGRKWSVLSGPENGMMY